MKLNSFVKRKSVQIIGLWIVAVIISNISFYFTYHEWPSIGEIVVGHTLYGILALPFSFIHTITFYGDGARIFGIAFIALLIAYWGIVIFLHRKYWKTGQRKYLIILSAVILLSSIKWLYYSMAMSGI